MIEPARRSARAVQAIALALCLMAPPVAALAQMPYLRVSTGEPRNTAIVMDARTGEVLYAERADSVRYPASVTKVMTLYLAFEALAAGRLHLNDMIVVSPLAAAQPATKLGLRAGDTITVEDAMHAMAVHSANDMAVAISERIGGTESRFAALMSLKAQQLGMINTRYVNANGLPDNRQVTTARDMAILTRAVLRDFPQYYRFFSTEEFTYRGKTYVNTNHLLGKMPGVDGLKTGFTNAAGFNLDASAVRNGNRLIAVVMGSSSSAARNANVESLLLTGFDVLERRARGERVVTAQNMFAQAPPAYLASARMPVGQGEGDEDPIDVVLTRGIAGASAPMAQKLAPGSARPVKPQARNWGVQVGEFRSHRLAKAQVEDVSRKFGRLFDNAEGSVDGSGRTYLARFTGFDEQAARNACSTVKSRGLPCEVRGPV